MARWNSSPHPISDIRDWQKAERLELRPDFQRQVVWSSPARIMLMDTILQGVPMPKIFLANTIREEATYRVVIDGQQRISAILDFLNDGFALDDPFTGNEHGKKFSELNEETQQEFLSYQIDFNEAINLTDEEVREVYARVNKYTVPLNKQELRRADFPGHFLNVSEQLAIEDYFEAVGIFSPANRRRYADVEFVSELLAAMIDGIQDKKTTLDDFYIGYRNWTDASKFQEKFKSNLQEIQTIFDDPIEISKSRFRQRADFYSLFLVINGLTLEGHTVDRESLESLREDLKILDETIRPESNIEICSEYAIKCVSQANSASSRRWREWFLKPILAGAYGGVPDDEGAKVFYHIMEGLSKLQCANCDQQKTASFDDYVLGWRRESSVTQLSNSHWIHKECVDSNWRILERPGD